LEDSNLQIWYHFAIDFYFNIIPESSYWNPINDCYRAVHLGTQAIMNRDSDIVVCGGQESMSQAHHTVFVRQGINGHHQLIDSVVHDVLTDAFVGVLMGNTGNVCMQFTPFTAC
jgi:acetyl-CoA acetyltransferase